MTLILDTRFWLLQALILLSIELWKYDEEWTFRNFARHHFVETTKLNTLSEDIHNDLEEVFIAKLVFLQQIFYRPENPTSYTTLFLEDLASKKISILMSEGPSVQIIA